VALAASIKLMIIVTAVFLTLVGMTFGSFADAVTWRIRTKKNFVSDRSECEHCHHKLGVWDLLPVVSWLMLGGKCRYCKHSIGILSPLVEVAMGAVFLVSYAAWPFGFETWQAIVLFGFWLVYMVMLAILVVYDLRWMLLPDAIVIPLIALSFADAAVRVSLMPDASLAAYASHVVLGVAAMAGVYWALYVFSKGKWVGYGDVKLAIFMGAVLGWQKTLLVLILANVIGLVIVLPGLLSRKLTPKSHVPFGPFMIAAFVIAGLFGDTLIDWYIHAFVLA
jgi:prepilin signal peptidase PulO-like enzyme (type II secretory pathway)